MNILFEQNRGLWWDGNSFHFIEQTLLPFTEKVVVTRDWRVIVDAIKRLAIRGAPAIGVSGAYASVLAWREAKGQEEQWREWSRIIAEARPTAVNLSWAVQKLFEAADQVEGNPEEAILEEANRIASEDETMCEQMADHGIEVISKGSRALTHCNTGFLVTYGIGTSLGVLRRAHEKGLLDHVYACEARPLGQGARLTMWELGRLGIPGALLCDSAAGRLMQDGKVDFVMLGADRIARNGDTANKIGTFQLAVLANRFNIPFYVVAPSSTFDPAARTGEDIPVEYRGNDEILYYQGQQVAPAGSGAYNPAFDVTPNELITAIIREDGIIKPPYRF